MEKYDHINIDKKWQEYWKNNNTYKTDITSKKEKFYILDMFPYPSGEGLHVGHPKGYIATDIYSRYKKMNGFEVLHPMGFDAFGLPAEEYAIKNKMNPSVSTEKNVKRYKEQLENIGLNYDWDRMVNTTDPKFYKWTQWIFKQIYKKGLAYQSHEPINWCPSCKTGLANEDLEDGKCERCGSIVEKKPIRQWVLKITEYADKMIEGLDKLNWPQSIKEAQKNWIGKSEGAEIDFKIEAGEYKNKFTIFTTRPDTIFGATYCVLAPEHKIVRELLENSHILNFKEVFDYLSQSFTKTEIERTAEGKEKTGVRLEGVFAINPASNIKIPVYVADYVLANYGTGAIMAVPAHDIRDNEFAKKYNIEIKNVVDPFVEHPDVIGKGERQKKKKIICVAEYEDKFVSVNWKPELGGRLFLGGTIEENESIENTVLREIKEETGYNDVEIVKVYDEKFHYDYYAYSKEKAFSAEIVFVHARLNSLSKIDTALEEDERGKFEIELIDKVTVLNEIKNPPHKRAFELIIENKLFTDYGIVKNSEQFNGIKSVEAKEKITEFVQGKLVSKYKLKDWVFARQRYWGEPFPIVFDENGKEFVVADSELPVILPPVENYQPTGNGESPLANIEEFVNVYGYINSDNEFVTGQKDDGKSKVFKRETNTMPSWAGSCWYYLRYIDPDNSENLISKDLDNKWSPVDLYVGGTEHATRHLIYARFWHKFLYDMGVIKTDEPFTSLRSQGLILAEDGRKMSKRWGNVVNPDDVVRDFGADALRAYEMFMGPFDQPVAWSTSGIKGVSRFLDRVCALRNKVSEKDSEDIIHKTIKKVSDDILEFKFNTAISQMMICINELETKGLNKEDYRSFIKILSPFAPHMCEEIWHEYFNEKDSIYNSEWPKHEEARLVSNTVNMAFQVNGKLRGTLEVARDLQDEDVVEAFKTKDFYQKYVTSEPKKIIVVKNKVVNIII